MEMKTASVISTGLHLAVLAFCVISFNGKTFEVTPAESLPVDFISEKEFSQLTKGIKDAPKPEKQQKLVVEKIKPEEPKPVEDPKLKVSDKPEIAPTQEKAPTPPPAPETKPVEKKAEAKTETPPDPVALEKADPIAEKIKQTKVELPPKKPPQKEQPKFDAKKIAALLDQREPRRNAAVGDAVSPDSTLGHVNASAAELSQNEIEAFRRRIESCWDVPAGVRDAQDLVVVFRVQFNQDGSIKRGPDVVGGKPHVSGPAFAESGRRAILKCAPYTMFRKETFNTWKDLEVGFDAKMMFR